MVATEEVTYKTVDYTAYGTSDFRKSGPISTKTLLHYLEDVLGGQPKPQLNLDDAAYLLEMGHEYNRSGGFCIKGHTQLATVDDRGVREYQPRMGCPDGVGPEV